MMPRMPSQVERGVRGREMFFDGRIDKVFLYGRAPSPIEDLDMYSRSVLDAIQTSSFSRAISLIAERSI